VDNKLPCVFLEHSDLRKNSSVGDRPSSGDDGKNPSPTPHGVVMDSLSPEKQYISGTELQISSLPWGFNKVC